MKLLVGSHEVVINFTAVDGRTFERIETITIVSDGATPLTGEVSVEGSIPLAHITGDNAIGNPIEGLLSTQGLIPLASAFGGMVSAIPETGSIEIEGLVPLASVLNAGVVANPETGMLSTQGSIPLAFARDAEYVTITGSTGNIASGTTTLTLSTNIDLEAQASVSVTRGGITCADVVVLNATTVTFTEPTDGLELGVNHGIILEAVA